LDTWNAERRSAAVRYSELLRGAPGIVLPYEPQTSKAVYHLYVVRTKDRDQLAEQLKANGISTGLHYPLPVHLQNCYQAWGYHTGDLPVTEQVAVEILSLPMFPGLTPIEQQRIADRVEDLAGLSAQR
jgi:dTDP-4-amino-4,6-dideoxygalactose transaminase